MRLRETLRLLQEQLQQIEPILQAVAYCIQFPSDSPSATPEGHLEKQEWEETNEAMNEQRQEFFVLFKNTAKLSLELTVKFVGQQLREHFQPQSSFEVNALSVMQTEQCKVARICWKNPINLSILNAQQIRIYNLLPHSFYQVLKRMVRLQAYAFAF